MNLGSDEEGAAWRCIGPPRGFARAFGRSPVPRRLSDPDQQFSQGTILGRGTLVPTGSIMVAIAAKKPINRRMVDTFGVAGGQSESSSPPVPESPHDLTL